jgi:hypothetical protein
MNQTRIKNKKKKKNKNFFLFFVFLIVVIRTWHLRVLEGSGTHDPLRSSKPWLIHEIQTQTKKQKKKKKVFNFFSFFVFVCNSRHLRVLEGSGIHNPWGPRNPKWFMNQTRIKTKKEKKFLFFSFFDCCATLNNHRRSAPCASCYEPRCEATWFVTCFASWCRIPLRGVRQSSAVGDLRLLLRTTLLRNVVRNMLRAGT